MIYNKKLGRVVVITIIILNFIVFIVKGLVGLEIGSLALLSDAVHTLSDSASSVAVYLGLKISEKPADEKHPYGHGRADQIAVLAVGLILILAAISFISDGIQSFLRGPDKVIMSTTFYIVIILTAIVKEIMADISYFVGKKIDSDSLKADAWHHRGDAITTVIVLIALFGSEYGYHFLDPIVGIGIALLLGYIGISYTKKAASKLLGKAPSKDLIERIKEVSLEIGQVKNVHNINVHDYGDKKAISLHMNSEPGTIKRAHEIAHRLQEKLEEEFNATAEVHFDPWTPPSREIKRYISEDCQSRDGVKEIHKIEISETEDKVFISFHLLVEKEEKVEIAHERATAIEESLEEKLRKLLNTDVEVQVHIEPNKD